MVLVLVGYVSSRIDGRLKYRLLSSSIFSAFVLTTLLISISTYHLAIVVTSLQNIQMLAGVIVPLYFFSIRDKCSIKDIYWFLTAAMYSLYVYLFGTLFVDKYIIKKACGKKDNKKITATDTPRSLKC